MVDDVLEIPAGQAHIQVVQNGAHARKRAIQFKVSRPIPHENADAVGGADAGVGKSVGELMRPVQRLSVGLPPRAGLRRSNDFGFRRHRGSALDQA